MKIYPVIHYNDDETCLSQSEMLFELGCDGVMLIHMGGIDLALDIPAIAIKKRFPEKFVGTNRLCLSPSESIIHDVNLGLDCTWHDRPGINTRIMDKPETIKNMNDLDDAFSTVRKINPNFNFFASVAFKYARVEPNPAEAAQIALNHGWIPTTSGTGTGVAAPIEKLQLIRNHIGTQPLAIASGITPDNVEEQAQYLDYILVATGLCYPNSDYFDSKLVKRLLAIVK